MRRLAEFWRLAAEQERRNHGGASTDDVLCALLPETRAPWGRTWCAEAATSVPEAARWEFVTAYHWLGSHQPTGALILPLFQREDASRHQQLDDYAYLGIIGAVTLPQGAPWRGLSWAAMRTNMPRWDVMPQRVFRRLTALLGEGSQPVASSIMRDHRNPAWGDWVALNDRALEGLAWVLHDGTEKVTLEDEARLALKALMDSRPAGQAWSTDNVVAWAELCAVYVETYRQGRQAPKRR